MNYQIEKPSASRKPAPGHALLVRNNQSYARTRNGAWVGASSSETHFEIPLAVLNSPAGVDWLNPGRCSSVWLKFEDGTVLSVDGGNDPIRTFGFGDYGYIQPAADAHRDHEVFRRTGISRPHPLLPNVAPTYYRCQWFSNEDLATFALPVD